MKEKEFLPAVRERLGIDTLNEMQQNMMRQASQQGDIQLLAPTGSGKTLAFLLPLLKLMKPATGRVQAVIIAPTRELVLQIFDTLKAIASGFHVAALYGGHKTEDEINSLSSHPDIIVATPGRLLDHSRRGNMELLPVRILVLDEFDKALELGFEADMTKIIGRMKNLSRRILTSATDMAFVPDFVGLKEPHRISYLDQNDTLRNRLAIHKVMTSERDKLDSLRTLLCSKMPTGQEKTIIFVNHRESAERVRQGLENLGVKPGIYHGALDQHDREKAITMFNNGSSPILVATDLAARGLDIEEVKNIVHYHQPLTPEAYTHRNGRTARIKASGDVYILVGPDEELREYVETNDTYRPEATDARACTIPVPGMATIYISAGKREKLSKGDIVGFLTTQALIPASEIGKITIRDHYSLVAVDKNKANAAIRAGQKNKIKGEKRKFTMAQP